MHAHVDVGRDNAEGLAHLLLAHLAAHVEEVGGRAAVQRHDVHGGHGQPRAVHQAADAAARQRHVAQAQLLGQLFALPRHAPLPGVVVGVAQAPHARLPVRRAVVKVQLGVHAQHCKIQEWVSTRPIHSQLHLVTRQHSTEINRKITDILQLFR